MVSVPNATAKATADELQSVHARIHIYYVIYVAAAAGCTCVGTQVL